MVLRMNIGAVAARMALLLVAASIAPGVIAQPPEPDRDQAGPLQELEALEGAEVVPLTPDEALDKRHVGKRVRWAGGVYGIDGRCLTVNFARSGDYGEPRWTPEPTYQAFVACGPGVYDADLVHPYTNVTIIGRITGKQYIGMGGGGSDGATIRIEKLYRWSDCLSGDDSPVCKRGFLTAEPVAED